MGTKTIDGDLNVTGEYQVNGSALATGTKLYKHIIFDSNTGDTFSLITTSSTPLNFATLNSYALVHNYLLTINVISFIDSVAGYSMTYDSGDNTFGTIDVVNGAVSFTAYDDWNLEYTTDTVTPL